MGVINHLLISRTISTENPEKGLQHRSLKAPFLVPQPFRAAVRRGLVSTGEFY